MTFSIEFTINGNVHTFRADNEVDTYVLYNLIVRNTKGHFKCVLYNWKGDYIRSSEYFPSVDEEKQAEDLTDFDLEYDLDGPKPDDWEPEEDIYTKK